MHSLVLTRISLVALVAAGILVACSSQQDDWKQAQQKNTVAAYQQFIHNYPNSQHDDAARQRIAQIKSNQAWQQARQTNTAAAYQSYGQQYPDSPHSQQARQRAADLQRQAEWSRIRDSNDITELQSFANRYPQSDEARQAQHRISQLYAQRGVKASGTGAAAELGQPRSLSQPQTTRSPQAGQTPAPASRAAPAPAAGQGAWQVQLAAFSDRKAADSDRQRVKKAYGDVLGERDVHVEAPTGGGRYYRLRTDGMSRSDARALCGKLKDRGADCLVVKAARDTGG